MGETQLSGPDLAAGIPESDLTDGAMISGHAFGKPVLLARRGEEIFAVSSTCTHYNGPLAEGAFEGDRVRCPWHHACFSLRTGEALAAPAMRPLERFDVERRDGRVYVIESEHPPRPARRTKGSMNNVVVIGGGPAGAFAAHELRQQGFAGSIVMITRDFDLPFDKPNLSKDYLAGSAPEEWIPLRDATEYQAEDIELLTGTTAAAIDAKARVITLSSGKTLNYDALLLAIGATPRKLDLAGANQHYLRTFDDAKRIVAAAANAKRAAVVGASFIGLEVAASLRARGLEVTVIGPEQRPLERVFGGEVADFIRRTHESHGVTFRLGRKPVERSSEGVRLDDGSHVEADLVVIGVGVVPDLELARSAGVAVESGIVVDDYLETTMHGIFAAGDAALWPYWRSGERIRVEHWVHAARQGQAAARNILGAREPFRDVPFFWSQHYDLVLASVGHASRFDDVVIRGSFEEQNGAAFYRNAGRIDAVVTLFRDDISLAAEAAMRSGDDDALERLARS